jgi:hypothetical protein
MLSGDDFITLVRRYFDFLPKEFCYELFNEINMENLFYRVQYHKDNLLISISYENRENYLQVIVFTIKDGVISEYDDREHTFHLGELNRRIMQHLKTENFEDNDKFFSSIQPSNEFEKSLLKLAKELRLCMKNLTLFSS